MALLKIYPIERFQLKTNLDKFEIIERFQQNISINNSTFRKRHTKKPKKLYEGIIIENEFKIQHKHIYGENGSWQPVIFGIIDDYSIDLEFKVSKISHLITGFFIFLSVVGSMVSIYFIVAEKRFEWLMLLPFAFLLIIYPAFKKGFKKEIIKTKVDMNELFR